MIIWSLVWSLFLIPMPPSAEAPPLHPSGQDDFVNMARISAEFKYDMKYATTDNFLKQKVYDCDACFIRSEVADALVRANRDFKSKGYTIQFFDCYRPLDVQKKMWKIYPNASYVANPYKNGSSHNRGGAVDITLCDSTGTEVDMGTEFDYFGKKAHHDYAELEADVLENRTFLKTTMEKHGFSAIRTEWWHYYFKKVDSYPVSNFKVTCD